MAKALELNPDTLAGVAIRSLGGAGEVLNN